MAATNPRRIGRNLNVWISEDLMAALDQLRETTRRTLKAEIEVVLEKHLREEGLWPRRKNPD